MKITKITRQQKRDDRYSVYVDEKYSFSLSEYQLAGSGLVIGKEYSEAEIESFATESQFGKMYERTLNYVMIRPRSEKEIKDYLTRSFLYPKSKTYKDKKGQFQVKKQMVDKEKVSILIQRVIDRLNEKGYINDAVFAKAWVNSRQLNKQSSLRRLRQELMQKGISENIIATVLQNAKVDEMQILRELIKKKRNLPRYQDDKKLIPLLLRQGFNYDNIKEVMGAIDES